MINIEKVIKGFQTPESRWAHYGPYYAMFPLGFAFDVVQKYSCKGDYIIDPFAGRGSSIFAGGVLGRNSLGIEINPVGWMYGSVKLFPAEKENIIRRLIEIYSLRNEYDAVAKNMPLFYKMCYCDEVLNFLLAARDNLDWERNNIDKTLMSIILVYLHGKLGEGLSNQLKMTKAMGMNYSIDWWTSNNLIKPPEINPKDFILKRIEWRYSKGCPKIINSKIIFGDSTAELDNIVKFAKEKELGFSLLFTSPPYYSITDYHQDQWLRLWLLGGSEIPKANSEKYRGRFNDKNEYYQLLDKVFGKCSNLMKEKSTIYVRTDKREWTFKTTLEILKKHFPNHNINIFNNLINKQTQTELFGNISSIKGEIDIILSK